MAASRGGGRELLVDVPVAPVSPSCFAGTVEPDQFDHFLHAAKEAHGEFRGRVVWNVNSTAQGGGVAEMLRPLVAYARGAGIDARWRVIAGDPAFFRLTKRIHNHLHGEPGDGGPLGPDEQHAYRAATEPNADALVRLLSPRDVVILHDPQTAGMVPAVAAAGAKVVWRCHIGVDDVDDLARNARAFLAESIDAADAFVFSRTQHVWDVLDRGKVAVIPPSIDIFAPKNSELTSEDVDRIVTSAGIVEPAAAPTAPVSGDGATASLVGSVIPRDEPLVAQVSRWDRLKDPAGVLEAFVTGIAPEHQDAHLALVGPTAHGPSDDPEGASVLADMSERWHRLPPSVRSRVHLVALPMDDATLNALMVNAIQRRAGVVVQKSLAEGFGLTVAEAMWKRRAVVASRVGGIQDQVVDGVSGVLVAPRDLSAFADAVNALLADRERASAMGEQAQERVRRNFLGPRHLIQYFELFSTLVG